MASDIEGEYLKNLNPQDNEDPLGQALSELAQLIKPLVVDARSLESIQYIISLWSTFRVYQLDPPARPWPKGEGEEGFAGRFKIHSLDNGWEIFDYGFYLVTSVGKNYGTYCTGKLLETTVAMIDILAKRGARELSISGNDVAKRAAWMKCLESGITISNYFPTEADYDKRALITKIQEAMKTNKRILEEVKRPL